MGQRYEGTLIVQTPDANSPTGTYNLTYQYPEATEEQIFNGCTAFNSNGKRIVGNARGGADNPIICKTEQEMTSLLTTDNVGKFVRFEGGNPAYTPITDGTAVNNVFFNTAVIPDFDELFDSSDADKLYLEGDSGSCAIVQLGRDQDSISESKAFQAIRQVSGGVTLTAITYLGYSYAYINCIPEDAFSPSDIGVEHWGWQVDRIPEDVISSYRSYNYYNVNSNQTVWGKYISQRLAFAAPYTYGQVYTIVESESALSYKPVYALDKLSNKATAATVLEGFSAYDETGKVITGTALKNNDAAFIARTLQSVSAESMRGITSIGDYAFAGCSSLSSIEIGKDITRIGSYAFLGAPSSGSLELTWEEENVGSDIAFGSNAYNGYRNTSVVIPARVSYIYEHCFDNSIITDVRISDFNRWMYIEFYDSRSNPLYRPETPNGGNLYVNGELLTKLDLSNTEFTEIKKYSFAGAKCLTEVILPNSSLTNIYRGAFESCIGMTKLVMPVSSITIAADAFTGCDNLTVVDIRNMDAWKGTMVYSNDNPLSHNSASHILIDGIEPSGVVDITAEVPAYTYQNCSGITGFTISDPSSIVEMSAYVFRNCTGMSGEIRIPAVSVGSHAFDGCTNITSLTENTDNIGQRTNNVYLRDGAFESCSSLSSVSFSALLIASIGSRCFGNCTSLSSVTVKYAGLRSMSVADDAFEGSTNISNVTTCYSNLIKAIPKDSLTSVRRTSLAVGTYINISESECENAAALTQYVFDISGRYITNIGANAFKGCTALNSFGNIPITAYSPSYVGDSAFEGCTALTSLTFNETQSGTRNVTFGSKSLHIGSTTNKATINMLLSVVPSIKADTFDTSKLEKIVVPAGKKAQYIQNTVWKTLENYIEEAVN